MEVQVVKKTKNVRSAFISHLVKIERKWSWFHREINKLAKATDNTEQEITYSRLYYTLKGAYQISEEQRCFWNLVLGTNI